MRPVVRLVGYDELRVELPYTAVDDAAVDEQVDALRERFADLADSEYPLIDDAYATIDITGTVDGEPLEGLTATDFLYRVGSGMVVPELDDQLRGTRPGAILEFTAPLSERFGERAGEEVTFRVIVKEAKQKILPEVTDEWVDEASEFETVDELRADIRRRLDMMQILQAQMAVRDKVLEAAADLVPVPAPRSARRERDPPPRRGSRAPAVAPEGVARPVPCGDRSRTRSVPRRGAHRRARAACSPTSRCAR